MDTNILLSYFWNPLIIRKDLKTNKYLKDNTWLSIHIEKNKQLAENILFTPNWNFRIQNEWTKQISMLKEFVSNPKYNCLIFWWIKENDSELVYNALIFHWIQITFKITSDRIYYICCLEDRVLSNEHLHWTLFEQIPNYFLYKVLWLSYIKKEQQRNYVLPLPWTKYYYEDKNWIQIIDVEIQNYWKKIKHEELKSISNYFLDIEKLNWIKNRLEKQIWFDWIQYIDKLKIDDILDMASYHDKYSIDEHWCISFNGEVENGYVYNEDLKLVSLISTNYKSLYERPRWKLSVFLYIAYKENITQLVNDIETRYWYNIINKKKKIKEKINLSITYWEQELLFLDDSVQLIEASKKSTKNTILFRKWIKIIWIWKSQWKVWNFIYDWDINFIICEIWWANVNISRCQSKNTFNTFYKDFCFFYWTDNDLWSFFDLCERWDFKEYTITILNWFVEWNCVLWWKVVQSEDAAKEIIINTSYDYHTTEHYKEIHYLDFFKNLRWAYKDEVFIPAFLQSIAMWWMNLRKWHQEIYPWMLITWKTGSWKSALASLMKWMLWYVKESRTIWLPSVSPQPLSVAACDNSILFCEELTSKVWQNTEEMLRNILNRNKWWRWFSYWNVVYNYMSPLFITWERAFIQESLNNRFVICNMSQMYWEDWWKKIVDSMDWVTSYKSIYLKYLEVKDQLMDTYKKKVTMLSEYFDPRHCEVWAYMYTINELFWFWIEEKELLHITKKLLTYIWFKDKKHIIDNSIDISNILIKWIWKKKMTVWVDEDSLWNDIYSFIYLDDDEYEKTKVKLLFSVIELNREVWEECIDVSDWVIMYKFKMTNMTKADKLLYKITEKVRKYVPRWF